VVDVTTIAMWAHPRAISTAFLRMMIERGDVTVLHEPLVLLTDTGGFEAPDINGGTVTLRSTEELLAHFTVLSQTRTVFFKDTLEYRYEYLFDNPADIADFRHTFIVREPAAAIASHHAVKAEVTLPEIGYEHQYDMFKLAWKATGQRPVVVSAERLVAEPAEVVAAYCAEVGLPYLPNALHWQPSEREEWQQNRRWHLDAIASSGFQLPNKEYPVTVANNDRLRSFYEHHRPFYDRLVEHAL
jgi:hypothetical protein